MTADSMRILLIEDDPDDILILKESLSEARTVKIKLGCYER